MQYQCVDNKSWFWTSHPKNLFSEKKGDWERENEQDADEKGDLWEWLWYGTLIMNVLLYQLVIKVNGSDISQKTKIGEYNLGWNFAKSYEIKCW